MTRRSVLSLLGLGLWWSTSGRLSGASHTAESYAIAYGPLNQSEPEATEGYFAIGYNPARAWMVMAPPKDEHGHCSPGELRLREFVGRTVTMTIEPER